MNIFSLSPFVPALLAASVLSGYAGTSANPDSQQAPMTARMADHHKKMTGEGCSCCGRHKEGMMSDMKQGQSSPQQGAMCMPGKDDTGKSGCGCCDMSMMGSGGRNCCGAGQQ